MQAGREIDLAAHRGGRHFGHLGFASGVRGQQLDHLIADESGIHIHDDQAAALPGQAGGRDGDIESCLRRGLSQRRTQIGDLGMRDPELDAGHRLARQPAAAVDVAAMLADHPGGRSDVLGQ